MPQSAIDRVARAFAPGHLGELSALVPVELVDEVLARHRATEQRVRLLPSRVVVYLLVAGALFAGLGWQQVWDRLVAGLGHVDSCPSRTAIALALRRVGPGPLRSLFEVLACPAPGSTRWRGLLVCALDGTVTSVPDSPANTIRYVKQRGGPTGGGSYPGLRLVALVACGTRTLIDATFGPTTTGETVYAQVLTRSLHAGMLLLADRGLSSAALVAAAHARGAHVLVRARTAAANGPALPVTRALDDGSWLSMLGATRVRVIDAQITSATTAATTTSHYRLVTTLLDPRTHPADQLAGLYHQRWQVETAYLELKSTILGGRVLRARTPDGIEQEVYALLIAYQALRTAIGRRDHHHRDPARPRQLHDRAERRTRPDHRQPARRRHRSPDRTARRDRRRGHRTTTASNPPPHERPHRQTSDLQVQRPRPQHRPQDLQDHPDHHDLDKTDAHLTSRHCP
ncbi:IS4 family transposase [Xylanimonas protaetiae]|uniref:IS4 family transposase n=1 Tax=Xylanimonas protaetiae TaxID=2509457 RepID=UPI002477D654|nr:IS4 family transposase [Xylanimonas protaetiae]